MLDLNTNPTKKEQRQFATLYLPAFFLLVGGIAFWRFQSLNLAAALWTVGVMLTIVGILIPAIRRPLFVVWMYAAFPIGWTISHLTLLAFYYLMLTPLSLLLRLFGYNPLKRRYDPSSNSYWQARKVARDSTEYLRQY